MRNQPVTPSKDNPIFFLWNSPQNNLSHKNWKHPNIRIMARTFANNPGNFVPSGYSMPANVPQTTGTPVPQSQLSGLAVAAALVTAHIFHAQGLLRGYGSYDGGNYDGGLFLQNFGSNLGGNSGTNTQIGPVLVGHVLDRIPSAYRASNIGSTSGLPPYAGYANWATGNVCDITLIMSSGIAECKYYSQIYFNKLKEHCDSYTDPQGNIVQLCYPKFILNDMELLLDNRIYYNPSGIFDIGHRPSLQSDPRYGTDTIYQVPSGTGWANISMSVADSLLTIDLEVLPAWFIESSSGFIQWWNRTSASALSYACYKSLYEPAATVFPNIKSSNYHSIEVPDAQYPRFVYRPRHWQRLVQPIVREDYNSPEIYLQYVANTGTIYTIPTFDDYENASYAANTNGIVPIISGVSTKNIIPWIMTTGTLDSTIYVNNSILGMHLRSCYDNNISEYIVWGNPAGSPTSWTDDAGYKTIEYLLHFFKRHKTGIFTSGFTREL